MLIDPSRVQSVRFKQILVLAVTAIITLFITLIALLKQYGARGGAVLRHCATNRYVVRSIPDGVIGLFH
jgi:hypothetical protein